MTSSIGHHGEDKNITFGVKNLSYRVEEICTLVEDRKLYNIYSGFSENFENFEF